MRLSPAELEAAHSALRRLRHRHTLIDGVVRGFPTDTERLEEEIETIVMAVESERSKEVTSARA